MQWVFDSSLPISGGPIISEAALHSRLMLHSSSFFPRFVPPSKRIISVLGSSLICELRSGVERCSILVAKYLLNFLLIVDFKYITRLLDFRTIILNYFLQPSFFTKCKLHSLLNVSNIPKLINIIVLPINICVYFKVNILSGHSCGAITFATCFSITKNPMLNMHKWLCYQIVYVTNGFGRDKFKTDSSPNPSYIWFNLVSLSRVSYQTLVKQAEVLYLISFSLMLIFTCRFVSMATVVNWTRCCPALTSSWNFIDLFSAVITM